MYLRLFVVVLWSLIAINALPCAFAQSNIGDTAHKQLLIIAQLNVSDAANDRAFWDSVKDSKNPDELKAYLEQFPSGIFVPLARARLKTLETGGEPSPSSKAATTNATGPKEIGSYVNFILYDNGTVFDRSTHLMWAAQDNGSNINWADAKSYCENYRGGGYTDWRMPSVDELASLYDKSQTYQSECSFLFGTMKVHLTKLIRLTCAMVWSSETSGSGAVSVDFFVGKRFMVDQSLDNRRRVLPVRYGGKEEEKGGKGVRSTIDK